MNTILPMAEVVVSGATTTIVATSVNADGLLTALIGFGTALVTVVGGELIKFLVAWFKKKTDNINKEDKKDEW